MAVEKAGLTLTVEQYNQFMQQVGAAGDATQRFGEQTQAAASQITSSFSGAGASFSEISNQLSKLSPDQLIAVNARVDELMATTGRALTGNEAYAQTFREMGIGADAAGQSIQDTGKKTDEASASFIAFGAAISFVSAKAAELVLQTTLVAGRIKELELLLEVTRQNAVGLAEAEFDFTKAASLNTTAVQAQVQGIRDLHLSGIVANETVAQMIRYNLDWTKATELAAEAQDAATFAAQDSSQALEGLIKGIATLQPRILRTYGIMVNLTEAYRVFAKENDIVGRELTQNERQQAALNAVLAQAGSITGAYEASLGSATKQIRSVRTDLINLAEAYGSSLEPAVAGTVAQFRKFLQGLTELSPPLRALISGVAAGGTSTLALTAAAGTGISVLVKLKTVLSELSGAALAASKAMLGIGGVFTVALGAVLAINAAVEAHEKAERGLKATILEAADSYEDYTEKMREAGLVQDTLTESIWKTVRAKEAELRINDAEAYIEAQEAVEDMVLAFGRLAPSQDQLLFIAEGLDDIAKNDKLAEIFANDAEYLDQLITSGQTFSGTATEDARKVVEAWTLVAQAFQATATVAEEQEAIDFIENLKEEMNLTGKEGVQMAIILDAVADAIRGLGKDTSSSYQDIIDHTEELKEEFWHVFTREQRMKQTAEMWAFLDDVNSAMDSASKSMEDANTRRNRSLEDLDTEYHNKSIDAWIDYQRALKDSEGDLAAFHAGTLDELLDLDRDYLQDRNDAWTKYQQDLADAERDLQRDIEDANRDRIQRLSDLEAEYTQDRGDALRKLNEDLEDAAIDHANKLIDIEQQRQQSLLDMETEYQRRLYDIQNLAQQKLRDLQDTYDEKASDARLKYLRQAMEQLEGYRFWNMDYYEQMLRDIFLTGKLPTDAEGLPGEFMGLYAKMLEELAKLQDDQRWEEEDLSDDIDREQQRRLEDLEAWLAEEQAAIEAAYTERIAKENERFAEEQESRRQDYERKLEDLKRANERERAEIELNHQRKLSDIRLQADREREELARAYARRLEDLEIEYNRERALIGTKLEEQNAEARQKYKEALEDLARAKERERDEINLQYDRTITDSNAKLEQMVKDAGEKYGMLPEALRPSYRIMKDDLHGLLFGDSDSLSNQWQSFIDYLWNNILQAGSPSRVMMKAAESMITGLEKGFGGQSIGDLLTQGFDAAALEANISAALPANMASLPTGMGASNRTYSSTSNLNVTAQYAHQSEASLRDDLALYNMMMGAWGR